MTNELHPFERAGLGKAPFRYVGMVAQDRCYGEAILNRGEYEATGVAVTTKPGGTCAYCGTYIVNMFNIRSADGREFHVGSDCVEKTCGPKLVASVKFAERKVAQSKRDAKAAAVRAELETILADEPSRARLDQLPHPCPHPAFPNSTMLYWVERMMKVSGAQGRAKVLKAVKAALEGK